MKNLYIDKQFLIVEDQKTYEIIHMFSDLKYEINKDGLDIVKYIFNNNAIPDYSSENELEFIKELINNNILTENENQAGLNNLKIIKTKPSLKRIFIELTRACNLNCKHCYNSSDIHMKCDEMLSTNEIKKLIDDAHSIGVWQFDVTGGEIFLRKDLLDILEYASYKGMRITMFTNLTIPTDDDIHKLKTLNIRKVITSIDGFSKEVHDSFRGVPGSLNKTIYNLKKLKENGIDVTVNTILCDHNIHEINQLIDFFNLDLEVNYVPDVILPVGRSKESHYLNKYSKLVPYLVSLKNSKNRCDIESCNSSYDYEIKSRSCGIADNFIFITNEGMINLCPSLTWRDNYGFGLGNIRDTNIYNVWCDDSIMSKFRNLDCNRRSTCPKNKLCSGGCRSRAYALTEDLNNPDLVYCDLYNIVQLEEVGD